VPGPDEEPSLFRFWSPCVSVARSSPRDNLRITYGVATLRLIVHWAPIVVEYASRSIGSIPGQQSRQLDEGTVMGRGGRGNILSFVIGNRRTTILLMHEPEDMVGPRGNAMSV
jgi:hypothetical protein